MSIIEEAYARAGIELTAEGRRAMQAWEVENAQHKHGKVDYSAEQFGLTNDEILRAFPTEI